MTEPARGRLWRPTPVDGNPRGRHRAPQEPVEAPRRRLPWVLAIASVLVVTAVLLVVRPWQPALAPVSYPGPAGSWRQVFSDDFAGSTLDTTYWQPHRNRVEAGAVPFNPVTEDAWFDPAGATVADGTLVLTVRPAPRTLAGHSYRFSSGMVQSTPALRIAPVEYIEARIRIPRCSGCWPAFWLNPVDRWPPEIDIAEYLESGHDAQPSFNYIDPAERKTGPDPYGESGTDYRDAFHTYGLLWDGERAVPYLDGRAYPALTATANMTSLPMMIILNLSVRGGYSTPPGSQMLVDWVRVWRPSTTS